jgi:hypothetical protein
MASPPSGTFFCASNRPFRDGHHIGRSHALAYPSHKRLELPHVAGELIAREEIQMRTIRLFAIAAAMVATGVGVWAASTTNARVAPSMVQGIEPLQLMMNAKGLATEEFADYTFVFN